MDLGGDGAFTLGRPAHASAAGGSTTISGQAASGTDQNGGNVIVQGGAKTGTGAVGQVLLKDGAGATQLTISAAGVWTNGAVDTSSDRRLKKKISQIGNATGVVLALRPVSYLWRDAARDNRTHYGFIAQEVEEIIPDIVKTNEETDLKSMAYSELIAVIVKAQQAQMQEIELLRTELERERVLRRAIEERLKALETR